MTVWDDKTRMEWIWRGERKRQGRVEGKTNSGEGKKEKIACAKRARIQEGTENKEKGGGVRGRRESILTAPVRHSLIDYTI